MTWESWKAINLLVIFTFEINQSALNHNLVNLLVFHTNIRLKSKSDYKLVTNNFFYSTNFQKEFKKFHCFVNGFIFPLKTIYY